MQRVLNPCWPCIAWPCLGQLGYAWRQDNQPESLIGLISAPVTSLEAQAASRGATPRKVLVWQRKLAMAGPVENVGSSIFSLSFCSHAEAKVAPHSSCVPYRRPGCFAVEIKLRGDRLNALGGIAACSTRVQSTELACISPGVRIAVKCSLCRS